MKVAGRSSFGSWVRTTTDVLLLRSICLYASSGQSTMTRSASGKRSCVANTPRGSTTVTVHANETLTVDFYARSHGLTSAEMNVLKHICSGMKPKEIARDHGVAISTVRSHICSIRIKTQTDSIRELINRVAVLPPITPAMKTGMSKEPTAVH